MSFERKKHLPRTIKNVTISTPTKAATGVIISELKMESIRWMKSRRKHDINNDIIVMSSYDELYFRQLFSGFDFDQTGNVSLADFKNALDWIRTSRHFKGLQSKYQLDDLEKTFIEMDIDGDKIVDFTEFCIGMTGPSSILNRMSKLELDKLFNKLLEYANIVKRGQSLEMIMAHQSQNSILDYSDESKLSYFKNLFTLNIKEEVKVQYNPGSQFHKKAVQKGKVELIKSSNEYNDRMEKERIEKLSNKKRPLSSKNGRIDMQSDSFSV
jgi:hypothetical protein